MIVLICDVQFSFFLLEMTSVLKWNARMNKNKKLFVKFEFFATHVQNYFKKQPVCQQYYEFEK